MEYTVLLCVKIAKKAVISLFAVNMRDKSMFLEPFSCFKCSLKVDGKRCDDPFTSEVEEGEDPIPTVTCSSTCVKWLRKDKFGN